MFKRMLAFTAALLIASAFLPIAAHSDTLAQDGDPQFRVNLGAFFPSKDVSRQEADAWLHVGIEWMLGETEAMQGYVGEYGVSVAYYGTNDIYSVPVLLCYHGAMNENWFYQVGAGVAFSKRLNGDRKNGFAWQAGVGYNVSAGTTPITIIVQYNGATGTGEEHNGASVLASFRF